MLPTIIPFLPNKKPNKKGQLPIKLKITYKRQRVYKSTGFLVNPNNFHPDKLISTEESNAQYKNREIKKQIADLELQFIKLQEKDRLSFENIKAVTGESSGLTFEKMANRVVEHYVGTLRSVTIKQIRSEISKLSKYKPDIEVEDMDTSFFISYEQHMRTALDNTTNTVRKTMVKLKSIFNKAKTLKIIAANPMDDYKVPKYTNPKRDVLTREEVAAFEDYADNGGNEYLRNAAAWFVLQTYCGVRYEDLNQWGKNVKVQGKKLSIIDHKTSTPHYVPLFPALERAIERVESAGPVYTIQAYNRSIQEIAKIIELDIKPTSHVARHTFAVNYLTKGGSLETLQFLMGHADLKTTSIYKQITHERVNNEKKYLG